MNSDACPACSSAAAQPLERVALIDQHLAYMQGDPAAAGRLHKLFGHRLSAYSVQRCGDCGLEFAQPPLAPGGGWYDELYSRLALYPSERWEYGIVRAGLSTGQTVVDYGCGSGGFLQTLQGRGLNAWGVDFSAGAVAAAVQRGLDARLIGPGGGPASGLPALAADHVVAFHVLEHLERPAALFEFARAAAAPGASLWIAVPSDRRASRVHHEADLLDAPPHHLTRWTEAAWRALGARHGWALKSHLYEPLATRHAVWEATRRLALYRGLRGRWRPWLWTARRALAAAVWVSRRHRLHTVSGFSMLARFEAEAVR